jgi:hypothetical protein
MNTPLQPAGSRRFHTFLALTMAAIVVIGFFRTFYFRAWFDIPPLTLRLHLHGAAMTLWVALFVVQVRLIAVGRRRLHMSLGIAGLALAAVAIVTSYAAGHEAAQLGVEHGGFGVERLYSNVLVLTLFGLPIALGVAFRKRPEIHKAFMLLAMFAAIGPAVNRIVVRVLGLGIHDSHLLVESALVLSALLYHWQTRRRVSWVLLCGGALLVVTQATRNLIGRSELWTQIGNWLIR